MGRADQRQTNLNRLVLQVVLHDFETIESILNKSPRWKGETPRTWSASEIKVAILTLLANRLVAAYIIHAEPPYTTAADPNFDTLERYWFIATDRGTEFLQRESLLASDSCNGYRERAEGSAPRARSESTDSV
jgi:hypothetical protein